MSTIYRLKSIERAEKNVMIPSHCQWWIKKVEDNPINVNNPNFVHLKHLKHSKAFFNCIHVFIKV